MKINTDTPQCVVFRGALKTIRPAFVFALMFVFVVCVGCTKSLYSRSQINERKKQEQRNTAFWAKMDLTTLLENSSTIRLYFSEGGMPGIIMPFEVFGTPAGAVVKYRDIMRHTIDILEMTEILTLELDKEEWHDFLTSLYNTGIHEWKLYYTPGTLIFDGWGWALEISSGDHSFKSSGHNAAPPGFGDAASLIGGLEKKTLDNAKDKMERWLEREYERRFGEAISDFTHSVTEINFVVENTGITLTREITGIFIAAINSDQFYDLKTELGVWDWLDFVKALEDNTVNADIDEQDDDECAESAEWSLDIRASDDKHTYYKSKSRACSPVIAVLDSMRTKVERYADDRKTKKEEERRSQTTKTSGDQVREFKEKYIQKYGEPASRAEFDNVGNFRFRDSTKLLRLWSNGDYVLATAQNKKSRYDAILGVDDWVDIMHFLHKSQIFGRNGEKVPGVWEPGEWEIDIMARVYSSWRFKLGGGEGGAAYPPNWEEFNRLMGDLEAKIIKNAYKK